MIFAMILIVTAVGPQVDDDPVRFHLKPEERRAIDEVVDRSARWLLRELDARARSDARDTSTRSPVLTNAMVLWTLSKARSPRIGGAAGFAICGRLFDHRQPEGGIYFRGGGLDLYESMASEAALSTFHKEHPEAGMDGTLPPLQRAIATMLVGSLREGPGLDDSVRSMDARARGLTEEERRALRFLEGAGLGGARGDGGLARLRLEGRRPFVFEPLSMDDPRSRRALELLRARAALDGAQPALVALFGEAAVLPPEPEMQYHRLVAATTLARFGAPSITSVDGTVIDWPRVLIASTLRDQRADGSWPSTGVTWKTDPLLVTCYALRTLCLCRDAVEQVDESGR